MVGNESCDRDTLVEGVEHVEGSGEYKQPLAEGDELSLKAIPKALKAVTRAATEINDPVEVDRIIAEQRKAHEVEQNLNEITGDHSTAVQS